MHDLKWKIQRHIFDLPTLPAPLDALSEVMNDPKANVEDAARVISADQASAFKVLKFVNSAYFGMPRRVDSISRAIVIMGFEEVRNLILASSVIDSFSDVDDSSPFRPKEFWSHSIAVGLLSRMIGSESGFKKTENFFVSGILHDVGKLVLFLAAKEKFCEAQELAQSEGRLARDTEVEVLGMDHSQAGALLADRWRVPEPIKNVIRHHHHGTLPGTRDALVSAVHVSDVVARMLELGHPGDDLVPPLNHTVWESLPLRDGAFKRIIPNVVLHHQDSVETLLKTKKSTTPADAPPS